MNTQIKLRQYSFKFFGIKHIVDVPELEYSLPLDAVNIDSYLAIKEAESRTIILN